MIAGWFRGWFGGLDCGAHRIGQDLAVYDRMAELVRAHKSTLVVINTRRPVERVSHYLEERLRGDLGEQAVAAHHGSLPRRD